MGENELLEFYQKKFNDLQEKEDKYREKIDKHLRELVADRHELEAEVLRRGEKISDLQKALVDLQLSCFQERERFLKVSSENDRLKKNEEKLHDDIRQLLSVTKEKDLRDRIIYILQDSKVEIAYRYNNSKSSVTSKSASSHKRSPDVILKEQIQALQSKLDEHNRISKSKSDVILDDCKLALQKSKEKLVENEEEIKKLQNKVREAESELLKSRQACLKLQGNLDKGSKIYDRSNVVHKNLSDSVLVRNKSSDISDGIAPTAKELHFTLVSLSQFLTKSLSILRDIQSTEAFAHAAKLPKDKVASQDFVSDTDVIQLQNYIRQCTRLSYEANNISKSLDKVVSDTDARPAKDLDWEVRELESAIEELSVATAEADLITSKLSQATFFDSLTRPKESFEKFGVKEMHNLNKYISDMSKMEAKVKTAQSNVSKALKFAERIYQKCDSQAAHDDQSQV